MIDFDDFKRLTVWVVFILAASLHTGCAPPTTEDLLRNAIKSMEEKNYRKAAVSLKQVIQASPGSSQARFFLGSALLSEGEWIAAEVELRKARELQYPVPAVAPLIAHAMIEQGQAKRVLDEFGASRLGDVKAQGELDFQVARAHAWLGDRASSLGVVEKVLAQQPKHVGARLLKARLMLGNADIAAAVALVDTVTADEPNNPEAWQVLGDLKVYRGSDFPGALQAFRRAVELAPQSPLAYAAIGSILLFQNDVAAAEAHLGAMKKALPKNVETRFLQANVLLAKEEYGAARLHAQDLLKIFPNGFKILQLAGVIEFRMGALKQAENYLTRALQIHPENQYVRRVLAQVLVRSGQSAKALMVLAPVLQAIPVDPSAQIIAAEAYLVERDLKRAEDMFRLAASNASKDSQVRLTLALHEYSKGNAEQAYSQLQRLATEDPSSAADKAMITAYLRLQKFDAALGAADLLAKKLPGKPEPDALAARSLLGLSRPIDARKRFEAALSKDPVYFPAVASLAALDMADGQADAAAGRFEAVLQVDAKNVLALLALADLRARGGKPKEEVLKLLAEAVRIDPGSVQARVRLVDFLRSQRDVKSALSAAKEANAAIPDRPEILLQLGDMLALDGEPNQAGSVYRRWSALEPKSGAPYVRLADLAQLSGDSKSAVVHLRRALELEPGLVLAQKNLIALLRKTDQRPQAYAIAKAVQVQRPDDSIGFMFEGDIAAEAGDWAKAAGAYRAGLGKPRGAATSARVYFSLLRLQREAEAATFASDWLRSHPKDAGLMFQVGQFSLEGGQLGKAEEMFSRVMELEPNNAAALNNSAFVKAKLGKLGAVELAEKANRLVPNAASYLDTLAFAHAQAGNLIKAVEVQREAVKLQPSSPGISFNLAKLLLKAGNRQEARQELEKLDKLALVPPVRAEVKRLLQSAE